MKSQRRESGLYVAEIELPRGVRPLMPLGGGGLSPQGQASSAQPAHWSTLGGTIAPSHIAAWTPKGAASLAASYVQYGTLGSGLTVGVAPALSNGWVFGATGYLKSGVTPANVNYSVFVQFSGLANTTKTVCGLFSGSTGWLIQSQAAAMRCYDGGVADNAPFMAAGNYGMAGHTPYRNGTAEANLTSGASVPALELFIGALNLSGSPAQNSSVTITAFVAYNLTLNPTQAGQLATAMAAL